MLLTPFRTFTIGKKCRRLCWWRFSATAVSPAPRTVFTVAISGSSAGLPGLLRSEPATSFAWASNNRTRRTSSRPLKRSQSACSLLVVMSGSLRAPLMSAWMMLEMAMHFFSKLALRVAPRLAVTHQNVAESAQASTSTRARETLVRRLGLAFVMQSTVLGLEQPSRDHAAHTCSVRLNIAVQGAPILKLLSKANSLGQPSL